MCRLPLVLFLTLLPPVHANAVSLSIGEEPPAGIKVERSASAAEVYSELLAVHARDRSILLATYDSVTKAAVWRHHLLNVLAEHPEFDEAQRAVIMDALALLTPQFFDIDLSDPRWPAEVDAPLQEITDRAQQLFPRAIARAIFVDLGPREGTRKIRSNSCPPDPEEPAMRDENSADARGTPRPTPTMGYCECSSISDWCAMPTYCKGGG